MLELEVDALVDPSGSLPRPEDSPDSVELSPLVELLELWAPIVPEVDVPASDSLVLVDVVSDPSSEEPEEESTSGMGLCEPVEKGEDSERETASAQLANSSIQSTRMAHLQAKEIRLWPSIFRPQVLLCQLLHVVWIKGFLFHEISPRITHTDHLSLFDGSHVKHDRVCA